MLPPSDVKTLLLNRLEHPADDELPELRQLRRRRQFTCPLWVSFDERLDGVPDHEWDVPIGRIRRVRGQVAHDRPSLLQRKPLRRGGEVQADDRRRIVGRQSLQFLERNGCESAQGYLLCPPLPPLELEAILARRRVEICPS